MLLSKQEKIKSGLPDHLIIGGCEISCFFLRDIGEISFDKAKIEIENSHQYIDVNKVKYNPNYFSGVPSSTPLQFNIRNISKIIDVELATDLPPYYTARISKVALLKDAAFKEVFFLFSNGILVYQIISTLRNILLTDDIIFLTNVLVKLNPKIICSTQSSNEIIEINPIDRITAVANSLSEINHTTPRTVSTETYSMILISRLGDEIESVLSENNELRNNIYNIYENEFHALCVRTIEDWEKRYPKNTQFNEPNCSLSPVGVLRINYRNTVAYEYPYNPDIVANLYYPAIIELRTWSLILAIHLSEIQTYIDQITNIPINEIPISDIEIKRKKVLDALDDFNVYILSTSRRTINFYQNAVALFGIKEITDLLTNKLRSIQETLTQHKLLDNGLLQKEATLVQNQLLDKIQALLLTQETSSITIRLINYLLGAAIAFAFANTLNLTAFWTVIVFLLLLFIFISLNHLIGQTRSLKSQSLELIYFISGNFLLKELLETLLSIPQIVNGKIVKISFENNSLIWKIKRFKYMNYMRFFNSPKNTEIITLQLNIDLLESLGSPFKYSLIKMQREFNKNIDIGNNPMQSSRELLVNIIAELCQYSSCVRSIPFFTSKDGIARSFQNDDIFKSDVNRINL